MQTSGKGGRDYLMTAVPIAMLVVFVMFMAGGPAASLAWLEEILRGFVSWAVSLVSQIT
jgi:hypothetical protein